MKRICYSQMTGIVWKTNVIEVILFHSYLFKTVVLAMWSEILEIKLSVEEVCLWINLTNYLKLTLILTTFFSSESSILETFLFKLNACILFENCKILSIVAKPGEFPWHLLLKITDSLSRPFHCGGSILNKRWVCKTILNLIIIYWSVLFIIGFNSSSLCQFWDWWKTDCTKNRNNCGSSSQKSCWYESTSQICRLCNTTPELERTKRTIS